MKKVKLKVQQLKTQAVRLQNVLDKPLLVLSILLILFSGYYVDLIQNVNDSWQSMLNLYRVSFLLLIYTNRVIIESILNVPYRIAFWLLLNHFYDRYHGETGWSINDTITVIAILIELLLEKYKKSLKNI